MDFELTDGQRAPRTQHLADGFQIIATRRRDQIDLELYGQYRTILRKQSEPGVAARRVGQRARAAGMEKTMLLGQLGTERHFQPDFARPDAFDCDAPMMHQALTLATHAHALAHGNKGVTRKSVVYGKSGERV